MRRRSFTLTGIVVALGAACVLLAQPPAGGRGFRLGGEFGGFGGAGIPNFAAKTITGEPFSANLTSQSVQTLANGNQIQRQETGEVIRDMYGRVYVETTTTQPSSSGSQKFSSITIYDPVAGYVYRLNPQKMTAVQSPIRRRPSPPTNAAPPNNNPQVQTTPLGTQTINGVLATGTQVTRTIPAGTVGNTQPIQIVRITWVDGTLQMPVQITRTDPRTGTSSMNLTVTSTSAPSETLFTIPSGYTVTSASARSRRAFPQ